VTEQEAVAGQEAEPVGEMPEKPAGLVVPPKPVPVEHTPKQRLDRVFAVMKEEGVDFRAIPIRLTQGMRGTFIADIDAVDIRTGQPLQRG